MKTPTRVFALLVWLAVALDCAAGKDVVVAQIVPLSGPVGTPGSMFASGAALYFDYVNDKGGVNGRRIRHVLLDDKYDVNTSLSRLDEALAQPEPPSALLTFGTASTLAIASELDRRKVKLPTFPTGSGSASLRQPFNRNLFHIRASYSTEFAKLIDILATTNVKSFLVVYQDDAFGRDSEAVIQRTLAELKLKPAVALKHDRGQQDISSLAADAAGAKPQAVLLATTATASGSFIKRAHADKLNAIIATISDTDPNDLIKEVGLEAARGVMLSQSLPDPTSPNRPMVAHYAKLIEHAGGKVARNAYTIEGYIQARVIVEALRRTSSDSPAALIDALESLKGLDLGGYSISFSERSHEGASFVDTAIVSASGRVIR